ncbi:hypothetical protein L6164_007794 [Bauhinia variegata]|uniref:Uncharacterized protein n=1 Tax=Bauhinia variegata TaxID=167791 RepID=A0ACB9PEU5_BAUVA|nr:hypothetical protein L6164_007794 [Bauhinia variegata]
METASLIPKPMFCGIKRYWRRRQYQRLHADITAAGRRKTKIIRLRGSPRRQWKIKPIARLRWVVKSPLKMLAKLKNAYVDFMLRLTGNVGALSGNDLFGGKRIPRARQVSKAYSGDAFEARLIYEISKVFIASRELNPM